MTKNEFLRMLKGRISHLPKAERRKILQYYTEMISERMDDGMSEQEAIAALGDMDELFGDLPAPSKAPKPKSRLRGWQIAMLIVGAPVWVPLMIAMLSLLLAFYIVIWSLVISFYAVFAALAVSGLAVIYTGIASILSGDSQYFFSLMGAGFALSGFALLWLIPCNLFAKAMAKVTAATAKGVFRFFFRR